jgi:long-chain fatty acid transport protein
MAAGKLRAQAQLISGCDIRPGLRTKKSVMMNRQNICWLPTVLLLSVAITKVSANGFSLLDQDAFATARGEAFVATADNPSAIYYNPAGITQLSSNNIRGGIYGIYLDPSFQPPPGRPNSGNTYTIGKHFAAVPQLFYTHTLADLPLSFGVGLYAPYGGSINWPGDTGFRSIATEGTLTYLRLNPVVAYQLLPSLSVAVGAMADYARIDLEQGLSSFTASPNYFRFSGDGFSAGFNVGVRWQPLEKVSLGATFRSATPFNFAGQTDFEQLPVLPSTQRSAHMNLTFPLTMVAGISYRPTPSWNMEFDANYTDWSSFGKTSIQQQTPVPYPLNPSGNIPLTLDWQASMTYEFGVTHYFDNGWHVSAGYVYNENSVPNAYYSPLSADMDRHFFSIGTGFKGRCLDLDIAYQVGYGPAHTVIGSTPSSTPGQFAGQSADGTYHFFSQAIIVTAGMRF